MRPTRAVSLACRALGELFPTLLRRLNMLENQCLTWPMPLVATAHVPVSGSTVLGSTRKTAATLDELKAQLASFHARMQREGAPQRPYGAAFIS